MSTSKVLFSALVGLSLLAPVGSLAVEPTTTLVPKAQIIKEMRADIKETRRENKQSLTEIRRQNLEKLYQQTLTGFEKQFKNLTDYRDRIQKRIDTKKAAGKNVTAAQAKLDEFKPVDLTAFKATVEQLKSSSQPTSLVPQLRQAANKVRSDLSALRQVLTSALRLTVQSK